MLQCKICGLGCCRICFEILLSPKMATRLSPFNALPGEVTHPDAYESLDLLHQAQRLGWGLTIERLSLGALICPDDYIKKKKTK